MIYFSRNETYLTPAVDMSRAEGTNDNAKLTFEPGKKYKIRVINMSALASMSLAVLLPSCKS
jgi:iron transport multicopper oxidase